MVDKRQSTVSAPKQENKSVKYLAGLFLTVTVVIIGFGLYRNTQSSTIAAEEVQSTEPRVPVVTTLPVVRDFKRFVVVQGNVEAKNWALVTPRIPGTIEKIFVDEGDSVTGGKTRLFEIDKIKLEKALEIRQYELSVATCAVRESQANMERTEADFHKAELDYNRFTRLFEKKAVTADALEQQESRYKQTKAMLKHALSVVDLSVERHKQAQAALAIAQKDLADAVITAPINGKISDRLKEPGEMGEPGKPVVRIDDTSVIEVSAYMPAQNYNDVIVGQTTMDIRISSVDVNDLVIMYKSPTINPKLRTFEIKGVIENPPEGIVPGAMAQIEVVLLSRRGLGVPSAAIQQRGGDSVVFVVRGDVSYQVTVQPGIETDGWTEIREGQVNEDAAVVTMGQNMVDDGTRVDVQKEVE